MACGGSIGALFCCCFPQGRSRSTGRRSASATARHRDGEPYDAVEFENLLGSDGGEGDEAGAEGDDRGRDRRRSEMANAPHHQQQHHHHHRHQHQGAGRPRTDSMDWDTDEEDFDQFLAADGDDAANEFVDDDEFASAAPATSVSSRSTALSQLAATVTESQPSSRSANHLATSASNFLPSSNAVASPLTGTATKTGNVQNEKSLSAPLDEIAPLAISETVMVLSSSSSSSSASSTSASASAADDQLFLPLQNRNKPLSHHSASIAVSVSAAPVAVQPMKLPEPQILSKRDIERLAMEHAMENEEMQRKIRQQDMELNREEEQFLAASRGRTPFRGERYKGPLSRADFPELSASSSSSSPSSSSLPLNTGSTDVSSPLSASASARTKGDVSLEPWLANDQSARDKGQAAKGRKGGAWRRERDEADMEEEFTSLDTSKGSELIDGIDQWIAKRKDNQMRNESSSKQPSPNDFNLTPDSTLLNKMISLQQQKQQQEQHNDSLDESHESSTLSMHSTFDADSITATSRWRTAHGDANPMSADEDATRNILQNTDRILAEADALVSGLIDNDEDGFF